MSYILDALKRADAQRERDPSRGIHAQPAALGPARSAGGTPPWVWAGAAAVVAVLGAAAAWYLLDERGAGAPPAAAHDVAATRLPAPAAAPGLAPPMAAPVPAAVTAPPVSEPVAAAVLPPPQAPQAAVPDEEQAPAARRRRRIGVPVAAVPAAVAPASHAAAAPGAVQPAAAAPAGTAAAAVPASAAAPAIATGLPPDAPKLAISGGVYSSNRAQRLLIVNGQVVNEGADLGAGVVLEEIRPKAAVLRFRGARYTVGF
jgi:general secretion pathway protein B